MNLPFKLRPAYKDYLWGGSRLNDDFGKNIDCFPLAETWECSTHPDGESIVDSGDFKGKKLSEVLEEHPVFLGSHPLILTNGKSDIPILIKLIDAHKDLSVQVHPDDDYALQKENAFGKTEMWYVLSTHKDSKLIYGFNQTVDKSIVNKSIQCGTIEKYLNYVPVKKDNVFFINPGTVHALCSGTLVAEIQQNSNITYRLYDYDRVDKYGNKRALHIEKALDVANLDSSAIPRQPMRVLKYKSGCASELLGRCKYFQVDRVLLNTEINRSLVDYKTGSNSFHVLLCFDGCGTISMKDYSFEYFKGDCIFIPADSVEIKLHGKAQFLDISC